MAVLPPPAFEKTRWCFFVAVPQAGEVLIELKVVGICGGRASSPPAAPVVWFRPNTKLMVCGGHVPLLFW